MLTTVSIGLVIVFGVKGSSIVEGRHPPVDPGVDFTVGLLALLAGYVVWRSRLRREDERARPTTETADRSGWSERMLARGARLAFVVGIVLNVVPGLFPFVALKDIAQLDYAALATVVLVIAFYVVMFVLVEVPLVAGLVAPARTAAAADTFNSWLGRNGRELVAMTLAVVGIYLMVRGIVGALG